MMQSSTPSANPDPNALWVFSLYRMGLSFLLIVMGQHTHFLALWGAKISPNFAMLAQLYAGFSILCFVFLKGFPARRVYGVHAGAVFDIVFLVWLSHLSGGINSGLPLLILVSLAGTSLLVQRPVYSLFYAAIASLSTLFESSLWFWQDNGVQPVYIQAGLLGVGYFAISMMAFRLNRQKAAETALLQILNAAVIERMPDPVVVSNEHGDCLYLNQKAHALLGETKDGFGVLKKQVEDLTRRHALSDLGYGYVAGGAFEFRLTQITPHHVLIWLSDALNVEEKARQLKWHSLTRLAGSMAHELKNPLGAIVHAAQLLHETPDLDPTSEGLIDCLIRNARRMDRTMGSLTDWASGAPPKIERCDLERLVHMLAQEVGDKYPDVRIQCQIPDQHWGVWCDANQLIQILNNLLENAVRHHEFGKPNVVIQLERHQSQIQLSIRDNGPGIVESQVPFLFEPFFTTHSEGSGFGLYLSKIFADLNHIRLVYEPVLPKGSCFKLLFTEEFRGVEI